MGIPNKDAIITNMIQELSLRLLTLVAKSNRKCINEWSPCSDKPFVPALIFDYQNAQSYEAAEEPAFDSALAHCCAAVTAKKLASGAVYLHRQLKRKQAPQVDLDAQTRKPKGREECKRRIGRRKIKKRRRRRKHRQESIIEL